MTIRSTAFGIPAATNGVVAMGAIGGCLVALWYASHTNDPIHLGLAAITFCFLNNTIFALHHEAVHKNFHPNKLVNDLAGCIFAAFFPTIFSVQRISHLGHHRRNRTDEELYDCYLPHQSRWLKTYWIYCLLFGFYWSIIPVAGVIYLICPWVFRSRWFQAGPARFWGFEPFVRDIASAPIPRVWLEGVFSMTLQTLLWVVLDLNFVSWLICYWTFGVVWSSIQYTDHAGAPRDVIEGAWNLRFTKVFRLLFLNYNFHLAHHRQPNIPWIYLPEYVKPNDASYSFWPIYFRLWLGAKKAPEGPGPKPI